MPIFHHPLKKVVVAETLKDPVFKVLTHSCDDALHAGTHTHMCVLAR
jgi:hypothetical protein